MFTLCEILGSFIYKFVLHLDGVCIFNYNLSLREPFWARNRDFTFAKGLSRIDFNQ